MTSAKSDVTEDDSMIAIGIMHYAPNRRPSQQFHHNISIKIPLLFSHSKKMQYSVALLIVALLASVSAFTVNSKLSIAKVNSLRVRSSRFILAAAEDSEPEFQPEDPKLFDMNRIVRLGRSRDQVHNFADNDQLHEHIQATHSDIFSI